MKNNEEKKCDPVKKTCCQNEHDHAGEYCWICSLPYENNSFNCQPQNEAKEPEEKLNKGIVKTVKWLRSLGFKTTDSGDGETHDYECDLQIPYVHMICSPGTVIEESERLLRLCLDRGVEVSFANEENTNPHIQVTYNPFENFATLSLYNVKL